MDVHVTGMTSNKCPELECLIPTFNLVVTQRINYMQAVIGFPEENGYLICNERREPLLWAAEESDFCGRLCYAADRPLQLRVFDVVQRREVLLLKRPLRCSFCCSLCCLPVMEVYLTTGVLLGVVQQRFRVIHPEFDVKDADSNLILIIRGPFFKYFISKFTILSNNRRNVLGEIRKEWSGFLRELLTTSDFFGISYPRDLAVRVKALLLGAVFLIVSSVLFLKNKTSIEKLFR